MRNQYNTLIDIPEGSDRLENTGVSGMIALEQTLQTSGVHQILLAQNRNQWWALVNTVMNVRVPYKAVNSSTSWTIIFSRSLHAY
jgi:hypothetical protein